MNPILQRIIDTLEQREMKGTELCRRAGISYSTWSMWKTRDSYPSAEHLANIAKALGTTTEYLLSGEVDKVKEERAEIPPKQFERLFAYWTKLNEMQQKQLVDFAEFLSGRSDH